MSEKGFAPARRRRVVRVYSRQLALAGLTLWLMMGVAGAQRGPAAQSHKADHEGQDQVNEVFKAFEEFLAVTRSASAPNSHWRVRLASWREAREAWGKASATPSDPIRDLNRCAIPLDSVRRLIERADNLFLEARYISDPTRAVELLQEHEKLQKQAEALLKKAEDGYRAARTTYLKESGRLPSTGGLMIEPERHAPILEAVATQRIRSVQEACRILREVATLHRQALASPELTESAAWRDAGGKLDELFKYDGGGQFHRDLMKNCHCPIMTARRRIERLRGLQITRLNPRARDARSLKSLDLAIQQEKQHIQTEIRRTEECSRLLCKESPSTTLRLWVNAFIPRTLRATNVSGRTYSSGRNGVTFVLGPEPHKQVGYLTDQRSFSNNPEAPSRFHSEALVEITAGGPPRLVSQNNWCSPTVAVNTLSFRTLCEKRGSARQIQFRQTGQSVSQLTLSLQAATANPCVDLFGWDPSPPIKADLTIHVDTRQRQVKIEGHVTQFPAFEAYVSIDDRPAQVLFQKMPVPEKSPWDLYLGPTENVFKILSF